MVLSYPDSWKMLAPSAAGFLSFNNKKYDLYNFLELFSNVLAIELMGQGISLFLNKRFEIFLTEHREKAVGSIKSSGSWNKTGLLQGSTLGPFLFLIYTSLGIHKLEYPLVLTLTVINLIINCYWAFRGASCFNLANDLMHNGQE